MKFYVGFDDMTFPGWCCGGWWLSWVNRLAARVLPRGKQHCALFGVEPVYLRRSAEVVRAIALLKPVAVSLTEANERLLAVCGLLEGPKDPVGSLVAVAEVSQHDRGLRVYVTELGPELVERELRARHETLLAVPERRMRGVPRPWCAALVSVLLGMAWPSWSPAALLRRLQRLGAEEVR